MFATTMSWHFRNGAVEGLLSRGTDGRAFIRRNNNLGDEKIAQSLLHEQSFFLFVCPRHCDERRCLGGLVWHISC